MPLAGSGALSSAATGPLAECLGSAGHMGQILNSPRSILRNTAVLTTGAAGAKMIGFLAIPVITRIYAPSDLGALSVFASLAMILAPMATLRYEVAIPLPRNQGLAVNLALGCLLTLGLMSSLLAVAIWAWGDVVLKAMSMEVLLPYRALLVVMVFITGYSAIVTHWAVRESAFRPMAAARLWQAVSGSLVKIGLGLLGWKPSGLLLGETVGQAGGVVYLSSRFWRHFLSRITSVRRRYLAFLMKRYASFPKYRVPSQVLLAFSNKAPLLFSASLFGADTTGQLSLAMMALALPVSLIGQAAGQALYSEVTKIGRRNRTEIYSAARAVTWSMGLASILPALFLLFLSPALFSWLFGPEWREAGVFCSILAIYLVAQFVSAPIMNILNVYDRQAQFLLFNAMRSLLVIAVFGAARYMGWDALKTLVVYSISMAALYAYLARNIFRIIRGHA